MSPTRHSVCLAIGLLSLVLALEATAQDDYVAFRYRAEIGLGLRLMPIGWFDLADASHRSGFRAYPAGGLAPFVDYRLNRYFSAGFSPEITLNVIPNRSDYVVGKMLAAHARVQIRYPNKSRYEPYALLTGGYSVILRDGSDSASGPIASLALGVRAQVSDRNSVFAETGYQRGFQTRQQYAYAPSYLVVSAGWQVAF
jgi:hypothetical protein